MSNRLSDKHLYRMNDAFYPRGHVFSMLVDTPAAEDAAATLAEIEGIGAIDIVPGDAIIAAMNEGAQKAGDGMPSVGREHQFMLRFVELAHAGCSGLLVEVAGADQDAIARALATQRVELAYLYRLRVIEELVDSTERANDAAAGEL